MTDTTDTEEQPADQEALAEDWASALAEQTDSETEESEQVSAQPQETAAEPEYERARLQDFDDDGGILPGGEDLNLDVILDIAVTLSMEIGRTKIPIRNLLQLNQGSVVELDRIAGEPMDVLVNGTLIAHGEVVVVNEKFGIRLTDVVSPSERVKKLK